MHRRRERSRNMFAPSMAAMDDVVTRRHAYCHLVEWKLGLRWSIIRLFCILKILYGLYTTFCVHLTCMWFSESFSVCSVHKYDPIAALYFGYTSIRCGFTVPYLVFSPALITT